MFVSSFPFHWFNHQSVVFIILFLKKERLKIFRVNYTTILELCTGTDGALDGYKQKQYRFVNQLILLKSLLSWIPYHTSLCTALTIYSIQVLFIFCFCYFHSINLICIHLLPLLLGLVVNSTLSNYCGCGLSRRKKQIKILTCYCSLIFVKSVIYCLFNEKHTYGNNKYLL